MAIATINPTTGKTEQTFEPHSREEVQRRIAAAQTAFEQLRGTTFAQRGEWARATADLLEADTEDLARLMTTEMGKPVAQSRAEIAKCAAVLRYYADHAEQLLAGEDLADPSAVKASRAGKRYQPLGVVLAVMPWNFPMWQVVRFAAPALMAGNTGLLKHASNVPQTALYLDDLFTRGGFPQGAFATLLVGSGEIESVLDDDRIKAATLTGSEPAGSAVASQAGQRIKPTVLELGGSDAFLVMPSADLDAAVKTAVTARVQNNGQSCIAAKRFIVHTDVYDAFTERFVAALSELSVGNPLDESTDVGPIATESGREDIVELVEDAKQAGASILLGGEKPEGDGWFYPVTVVADIPDSARILTEETFGPVASLYRVADLQEAVQVANQTPFGLSSAIWTQDAQEQEYAIENLEAGGTFINGMTASYPQLPFGGVKHSGYGRELAAEGIRAFCSVKTVWVA